MDRVLYGFRDATFAVALATSIVIHVSAFATLARIGGGIGAEASLPAERPQAVLEATLVARAPVAPVQAAPVTAAAPVTPALVATGTGAVGATARHSSDTAADPSNPVGGRKPRVVINDGLPRARFGESIEGEALAQFPAEVQFGVIVPENVAIPYPRAALAESREATVLVWAVISAKGVVEEYHFVEGSPGFTEAVEEALPKIRFAPARNDGHAIRYYTTLEFSFRIEAGSPAAVAGSASRATR